jgi:ubiquinol-cytochrome c reductase cytochrome b subunit
MPPSIESYVIAFGPIIVGLILFLLPLIFNKGERSPVRRPWSIIIVLFIVTMIATLWNVGIKAPWSPHFNVKPLPAHIVGNIDDISKQGADLFYHKGCLYCHTISDYGGKRGPDLSTVSDRLTPDELKIRIVNGGKYMPPYGPSLSSDELNKIISFLKTRKTEIKQIPER